MPPDIYTALFQLRQAERLQEGMYISPRRRSGLVHSARQGLTRVVRLRRRSSCLPEVCPAPSS